MHYHHHSSKNNLFDHSYLSSHLPRCKYLTHKLHVVVVRPHLISEAPIQASQLVSPTACFDIKQFLVGSQVHHSQAQGSGFSTGHACFGTRLRFDGPECQVDGTAGVSCVDVTCCWLWNLLPGALLGPELVSYCFATCLSYSSFFALKCQVFMKLLCTLIKIYKNEMRGEHECGYIYILV